MGELLSLADAEVLRLWDGLRLGYTESRGLPLLRREIAAMHRGIGEDDVLEIVPEEGIYLAMQQLVASGDHVVVTAPAYQSLHEIARAAGARISRWMPEETSAGWRFDPGELRRLASAGVKLIVVNFPHNPTGFVPSAAELDEVVAIAREHGAWIFSDEMYRTLETGAPTLPSAAELYEKGVALSGLSKTLGAPGLRVGWLITRDRAMLARIAEAKDWTTICGSAPGEILAVAALRGREKLLARNRAIIARGLDAIDGFVAARPGVLGWSRPRAGSTGLARLLRKEPASAFCDRLLREKSLLLLPSALFDFGDAHVRLGFGRADFPEALAELRDWLGPAASV